MSDIVERLNQRAAGDANSLWTSAVDHIMALRAERNSARADLAEALSVLREVEGAWRGVTLGTAHQMALAMPAVRSILSKHQKPDGGAT